MSLLSSPPVDVQRSDLNQEATDGNAGWLDTWCRAQVVRRLAGLVGGCLTLQEGGRRQVFGDPEQPLQGVLCVRRPRFYRRVAFGGTLGAAEAYLDGDWTTDDLLDVLQVFAHDWSVSCEIQHRSSSIKQFAARAWTAFRRNTLTRSRKNIAAHYDLSNDFYQLWLDETMAYSCAIFPSSSASLAEASQHKYELACQKLDLQPGDHLLEIGTGWGGLAVYAAEQYGCRVTTTTISRQQYEFAQRRITERGLSGQVTVIDRDYRQLAGRYDKLVSIEMIEAVGHEYLPVYFGKCNELLKSGGKFLLQAITIPDQRYLQYKRSVDFIQRYIFPGGALPSLGAIHQAVGGQTELLLTKLDDYAADYAQTLMAWRRRFFERRDEIQQLGFDDRFVRLWDYYLCYCAAGFRERQIGVAQLLFERRAA